MFPPTQGKALCTWPCQASVLSGRMGTWPVVVAAAVGVPATPAGPVTRPPPPPLPLDAPHGPVRSIARLHAAPTNTVRTTATDGRGTGGCPPPADGAAALPPPPMGTTCVQSHTDAPGHPLPGGAADILPESRPGGWPQGSLVSASTFPGSVVEAAACVAACRAGTQTPVARCAPCCGSPLGTKEAHIHRKLPSNRAPPASRAPAPSPTGHGDVPAWLAVPGCYGTQNPWPVPHIHGQTPVSIGAPRPSAPGLPRSRAPTTTMPARPAAISRGPSLGPSVAGCLPAAPTLIPGANPPPSRALHHGGCVPVHLCCLLRRPTGRHDSKVYAVEAVH